MEKKKTIKDFLEVFDGDSVVLNFKTKELWVITKDGFVVRKGKQADERLQYHLNRWEAMKEG